MPLWRVGKRRRSNLISCFFHAVICSFLISFAKLCITPICTIWNWINIHASRKWLNCSQHSTNFPKDNFCSNIYFSIFLFCFLFVFARCKKVSLPVTNATGTCKFVWKSHCTIIHKIFETNASIHAK